MMTYGGGGSSPSTQKTTLKGSPALQDAAPSPLPPQLLPQASTLGGLRAVPPDWRHLGAGRGKCLK